MTAPTPIPDHVPPELVVDLDIYSLPDSALNPQLAWTHFADSGKPLVYAPYYGGHWVPTVPEAIVTFQRDPANFSSKVMTLPDPGGPRLVPIMSDPPDHSAYKKTIMPIFSARALKELQPKIRALAVELIEELRPRGECDFVADFALKLPIYVFLEIMGLPKADGPRLTRLVELFVRDPDATVKGQAIGELVGYIDSWIEKRLEQPGGEDAISLITRATIDGRPYTRDEMLRQATLLATGGLDSVAMHLSFIALYLAQNPSQANYVTAQLDDLNSIVTEFNRRFPIANTMRILASDYEYEGVAMKAGDMIALPPSLYNFNEAIFPDAEEVDFTRPRGKLHLTFGTGIHACPGAGLARLEVQIFLQEWLTRIPNARINPEQPPLLRASITNSVDRLSLVWDV